MVREIGFRAKNKSNGLWFYGTNQSSGTIMWQFCKGDRVVSLSDFWDLVEREILDPKTVCEYVEFVNHDGSKGCGFEKDIIAYGGDNHNGVITFGQSHEVVGFYVKESVCRKNGEKMHRTHGLPPTTVTVKIIGDTINDKKLASRWGRS